MVINEEPILHNMYNIIKYIKQSKTLYMNQIKKSLPNSIQGFSKTYVDGKWWYQLMVSSSKVYQQFLLKPYDNV